MTATRFEAVMATPFGGLRLQADTSHLLSIDFLLDSRPESIPDQPILIAAATQLARYFDDPCTPFDLPLGVDNGTDYRRRVWNALVAIPPGQTATYGSLAHALNSGPRAVASACRANAFPIIIPCHRVLAAQGLGGYCGELDGPLLEIKRWLLKHEGGRFV